MATIWKYKDKKNINIGKRWVDDHGTRHPKNWMNWTEEEKVQKEVKECVRDSKPDSRLYTWFSDDFGKITSKDKPLDEVKTNLTNEVKSQQKSNRVNQTHGLFVRQIREQKFLQTFKPGAMLYALNLRRWKMLLTMLLILMQSPIFF